MTNRVGVLASTDWLGPGREYLIIVSGPDVSYGIVLSSLVRVWLIGSLCFHRFGPETQPRSRCYLQFDGNCSLDQYP